MTDQKPSMTEQLFAEELFSDLISKIKNIKEKIGAFETACATGADEAEKSIIALNLACYSYADAVVGMKGKMEEFRKKYEQSGPTHNHP